MPSIALLLDFFSVKEAAEGFLYISKRSNAKLIISDLLPSHKYWKEHYFFVNGHHWEYNPFDREDTLGVQAVWTIPKNLREFSFALVRSGFKGHRIFLTLLWSRGLQVLGSILVLKTRR